MSDLLASDPIDHHQRPRAWRSPPAPSRHRPADDRAVTAVGGPGTAAALTWISPEDERFQAVATEMIAAVRHHVEEEEQKLLPKFRDAIGGEELESLGERLEQAMAKAPKKPDPDALLDLTRDDLYEIAQKIDLEGRSEMDKNELARAIAHG